MKYIAHVRKKDDGNWDNPQTLEEHIRQTAELTARFAGAFDSSEWGYALGILHDAGKGTDRWQAHIRNNSGYYDEEASSETMTGKPKHAGAGAKLAEELFGTGIGRFLSYCIAGHHAGLSDWSGGSPGTLEFTLQHVKTDEISEEYKALAALARQYGPKTPPWQFDRQGLDVSLWIRMLFSCLVDADRLDTERYMDPQKSKEREGYLSIADLHTRLTRYMSRFQIVSNDSETINETVYNARQSVLAECLAAADKAPGFFSLTVPTGGGKTLSSMAFALKHAEKYEKARIIYVIPYTSIIEQNADVFRDVFGDDQIVEHHSSLDTDDTSVRSRLAVENWDAPIIITTTVQFFESLFAAQPSRCRKLHTIVNSVVILDEAQLLPSHFLEPILAAMQLLVKHYRVSFVICTATQPMFEKQKNFPQFPGLPEEYSIREIIHNVPDLYEKLKRVDVVLPKEGALPWERLASELSSFDRVLCIVSDRKSCRELYALMPDGTYHLSALMCAQHRSEIIAEIKDKLKDKLGKGNPIRVISTQLVEAGVDIDFPVVYRAMAGLDSIAQAAGRCNREGKLNAAGALGKVVVFNAPRPAPAGMIRKAADTARRLCENGLDDPIDYRVFKPYFSELYWKANSLDDKEIMKALKPNLSSLGIRFRTVSELFTIIENKNQKSIVVRYGESGSLIDLVKRNGERAKMALRKLQRYTITVYSDQFFALQRRGSLEEIMSGVFALTTEIEYDKKVGLQIDEIAHNPEDYIV